MKIMRLLVAVTVLTTGTAVALASHQAAPADKSPEELTDIQERGQAATQWFYDQEFDKVLALGFTDQMSQAIEGDGGLSAIHSQLMSAVGAELEVLEEQVVEAQGMQVYVRTVRFENAERAVVQWAFDSELRVGGFLIRPAQ